MGERTREATVRRVQRLAASAAGNPDAPIANGLFIFYLALMFVVLAIAVEAIDEWRHGSGEGSIAVDALWRVSLITSRVCQVALSVLLAIWGYRQFSRRKEERR